MEPSVLVYFRFYQDFMRGLFPQGCGGSRLKRHVSDMKRASKRVSSSNWRCVRERGDVISIFSVSL